MKINRIVILIFLILFSSCDPSVRIKTEYHVDRAGKADYKEIEYEYISGKNDNGGEVIIKHGLAREFYPAGSIKNETNFENGMLQGEVKSFYENGKMSERSSWTNNQRNGLAKYYYQNGSIYQESNYKKGKLNGEQNAYHENGKLKNRILYRNDSLWQVTLSQDTLGNKLDEFSIKNGNGVLFVYYLNGKKQSETQYKNGLPNGTSNWFYDSGEKLSSFFYSDGKKSGELKSFHKNGKLAKESFYKNDILIGIDKAFNESGVLIAEINYKKDRTLDDMKKLNGGILNVISQMFDPLGFGNGVMDGSCKIYYDNGKPRSEEYYVDGLQDSLFREYYPNGILKTDIYFNDNYESGKRYEKRFDKNGRSITSLTFDKNK